MSNLLKKDKGFTLIEIVLVLAIAGLLLVIVFLAVSGAQKARRDTQRKNDLSRLGAGVESFASNTNGVYPTTAQFTGVAFASYVPANFTDPTTGAAYALTGGATPGDITYTVGSGTTCDGAANSNARVYTLRMQLEQGIACRDNK
ncbi:MAG TPA: type II secretion system protein [Candidatus Saccharimonadia bacterium]|nr:type II secretion system protein [Candidatus Saccharimonadia bacterium]